MTEERTPPQREDLTLFVDWYSVWPGAMGPGPESEALLMDAPRGVRLVVQEPERRENVVIADRPWEQSFDYATVVKADGIFRLWYNVGVLVDEQHLAQSDDSDQERREDPLAERPAPIQRVHYLCYAESDDGYSWRKPEVGLYDFGGSTANNIVFPRRLQGNVFADPACGFRLLECGKPGKNAVWSALRSASSADGIHWREDEGMVLDLHCDTQNVAYYDEGLGQYVAYVRYARGGGGHRRAVGRTASETFRDMPHPEVVFEADSQDPPPDVIYTPAYTRHPHYDGSEWKEDDTDKMGRRHSVTRHLGRNMHFMFPSVFHMDRSVFSVQLAVSRDGRQWTRPERRPLIAFPGDEDCTVTVAPGLHELEPGLWGVLYGVNRKLHNTAYWSGPKPPDPQPQGLSWALWKENRLVALQADADGTCTVVPPRCPKKEIRLNIQTLLEGWIRVELIVRRKMWPPQLQEGIEGYTFADCDLIRGDSLSHTVTWRGNSVLPQLDEGEELALRLHLSRARLFAIHSS